MPKKNCKDAALMEEYRAAHIEEGYGEALADYCVKECAEVVKLSNGLMVGIDKKKVQTRFCFGYSDMGFGPTYEEASRECRDAGKNESHFIRENMKEYANVLQNLSMHGLTCMAVLCGNTRQLRGLSLSRITDVLDAVGGEAFLPALKGQEIVFKWGTKGYVCTDEDVALLRDAYERVAASHLKKCRAYLKRYGLSKLTRWTYWMDE